MQRHACHLGILVLSIVCYCPRTAHADTKTDQKTTLKLGRDDRISLEVPAAWKRVKPRVNFIDYEFAAPAPEGEKVGARITVLGAGGSVQANIDRWKAQFSLAGRKLKVEKRDIGGQEVHVVDLEGTYLDRPAGRFALGKTTPRDNYRVLGAIIVTRFGRYYIKMVGPRKTVGAHEKAFRAVLDSLKVNDA